MNNETKTAIIDLVKDIAVINRIMVRDEKKMSDTRWRELMEQEATTMKTIAELLDKEDWDETRFSFLCVKHCRVANWYRPSQAY